MRYVLSRKFKRSISKLAQATKRQFIERRKLFEAQPYHPLLHNHALTGAYLGYRSFSVNGDTRAIFVWLDPETVHLIDIGTHSHLYG